MIKKIVQEIIDLDNYYNIQLEKINNRLDYNILNDFNSLLSENINYTEISFQDKMLEIIFKIYYFEDDIKYQIVNEIVNSAEVSKKTKILLLKIMYEGIVKKSPTYDINVQSLKPIIYTKSMIELCVKKNIDELWNEQEYLTDDDHSQICDFVEAFLQFPEHYGVDAIALLTKKEYCNENIVFEIMKTLYEKICNISFSKNSYKKSR